MAAAAFFVYEPGVEVPREVTHVFVHPSMKVLPERVFLDLRHLKEVVLPEGLREIGPAAFRGCWSLDRVSFPSTLLRIHDCGFSLCTSLTTLHFREGLTEIGERAFIHCTLLKHLSFSSTVTAICDFAFMGCSSLEILTLVNGIRTIGGSAFQGCVRLEDVVLPASLTQIGRSAFLSCQLLRRVKLSGDIQLIRKKAFKECNLLNHIMVAPKSFIVEKTGEDCNFSFATDGTIVPYTEFDRVVITSECFHSMSSAVVSALQVNMTEILGMLFCVGWDDKHERLQGLLAPHERRRKKEVAGLLELGLRKTDMRRSAETGPGTGEERPLMCKADVIGRNVMAFL